MFLSIEDLIDKTISADIVVIGAGAAGITIAAELASSGRDILVLEGGALSLEQSSQDLYAGEMQGTFYKPHSSYLSTSRLRFFGGTTNHWTGWVYPFDELDFKVRPWIPESGWPFGFEELAPWYGKAKEMLRLPYLVATQFPLGGPELFPGSSNFRDRIFQIYPRRLGLDFKAQFSESKNVRFLLNSNVCEILWQPTQDQVREVLVKSLNGRSIRVRGKAFVLACGGVENARLLLASRSREEKGLGNSNDLVGRYFSDHPHIPSSFNIYPGAKPPERYFYRAVEDAEGQLLTAISPTEVLMEREGLPNFSVQFQPSKTITPSPHSQHIGMGFARGDSISGGATIKPGTKFPTYVMFLRAEQTPNSESRVTLLQERDALGVPKVSLDWKLSSLDFELYRKSLMRLAREMGAHAHGRMSLLLREEGIWPERSRGGNHHMGTTRMHDSPSKGVVDSNSRVHSLKNLYVAGSSVFPTTSCVNPTLTIIALSMRLAAHLKGVWL